MQIINYIRRFELPVSLGYLLFFMMLFVPTSYNIVKGTLLVLVLGDILIKKFTGKPLRIHRTLILWVVVMCSTGLIFILIGFINNAPGAIRSCTVYVLWPLVFLILASAVNTFKVIDNLLKLLVLSSIAIALYSFSYILFEMNLWPDLLYIGLDQGQAIGIYDGFIEYCLHSISSLIFLVPFLITAIIFWSNENKMPVSQLWLWIATSLVLIAAILTGRKVVWLTIIITPMIITVIWLLLGSATEAFPKKYMKVKIFGLVILTSIIYLCLNIFVGIDFFAIEESLYSGFDFGNDEIAALRSEQFFALLKGWLENPLLGSGLGGTVEGMVRSDEQPWSYELSYMALLFHTGIIGVSIYFSGVAWIFVKAYKIIRSGDRLAFYFIPVIVGSACFLIANGTNPYLEKFDYMWIIFLPIALINYKLLNS
jgi:hypothetical protein